jgi:hypothetical protein
MTPDGWVKVAALFVEPGAPRRDKVIVVERLGLSDPSAEEGDRVGFYVQFNKIGTIDSTQARFSRGDHIYVREDVFLTKQPMAGSKGLWRIEGPVPVPHLKVDAAIRYATQLRDNAKDPEVRRNADRTLGTLRRLRSAR